MTAKRIVEATGEMTPIDRLLNEEGPTPVPGEHLWVVLVAYRINPVQAMSGDRTDLDANSVVTISDPGCYWCEQVWEPGDEHTRCTGDAHALG